MKPVYKNYYSTISVEQLLVHLHFHGGVATVRDNAKMSETCPSRTLFKAVESRMGELRAEGYSVLSQVDLGVIHVYAPSHRREYHQDKYGMVGPMAVIMLIFVLIVLSICGSFN